MQKDFMNLPHKYYGDMKIYTANDGITIVAYQTWQKPKWANIVYIVCIGGGGGGGGGRSRTAGNPGGGGGGGAASGIARFICPAMFLPDTLYVVVGGGGVGGAANNAGSFGLYSLVSTSPTNQTPNTIIANSNAIATDVGQPGTTSAAGTGGAAAAASSTRPANTWGLFLSSAGIAGTNGGVHTGAVGTDITAWGVSPLSGGAGGAGSTGTDFAGGNVTATALLDLGSQGYFPSSVGGIALGGTAAGIGVNGSAGEKMITPFFNSGGAGGGSNDTGVAGDGGAGGYGCGGGGGGAGTTGGRGGNGGSGLVIIATV